jgi:hypothetical protein
MPLGTHGDRAGSGAHHLGRHAFQQRAPQGPISARSQHQEIELQALHLQDLGGIAVLEHSLGLRIAGFGNCRNAGVQDFSEVGAQLLSQPARV